LAFVAYWGIILFGYDTWVHLLYLGTDKRQFDRPHISGIAGGVVQAQYFQIKFGFRPAEGPADLNRINDVSSNVVSVLQAGAFFGALSSAPVSGESLSSVSILLLSVAV
jgi:hypothetical protein